MRNRIERAPARVAARLHILAFVFLGACSSQATRERSEPATSVELDEAPSTMVQWMFDPTPDERQHLDSLLDRVDGMAGGRDLRLGAALYRFDAPAAPERYLLIASRDTTPPAVLGEQEISCISLPGKGSLSLIPCLPRLSRFIRSP